MQVLVVQAAAVQAQETVMVVMVKQILVVALAEVVEIQSVTEATAVLV
jgi:hypothetical protein